MGLFALIGVCLDCIRAQQITILDIVLIVLNFSVFASYTYLLFEEYLLKTFNIFKKTAEIIFKSIFYIGFLGAICLLICGYLNIISVYSVNTAYLSYTLIGLTVFSFFLYVLRNKFLQYATSISLIVYRITMLVFITITSLLYVLLSIKCCLTDAGIYDYISLLTAFISIWCVYLSFYHNFVYLNYKRSQYLLFLRNFSMDERIVESKLLLELENACNRLRLFFIRIGNPRTVFDGIFPGKTFYLKTVNWKELLRHHIKDAKVVFTVMSYSDGLFWEIFNHVQYSSKFIYHILDIVKMREDLKEGKYDSIKHTKLGGILFFVCNCYNGPFAVKDSGISVSFTFNNDNLIISCHVEHIIECMVAPNNVVKTEQIDVIKLGYYEELKKESICYQGVTYIIG